MLSYDIEDYSRAFFDCQRSFLQIFSAYWHDFFGFYCLQ